MSNSEKTYGRMPADELHELTKSGAEPSLVFFLMLSFSAVIAALGLLGNSAPAIIGAMIIAPLMTPIISLSYGMTVGARSIILRSCLTILLGMALVVAISYGCAQLLHWRVMGSEILARSAPTLIDLGVALAAGGAAAFAHSRISIANSLAGVAIAVALVPPLAVTGISLAIGSKAVSGSGTSFNSIGFTDGGYDVAMGSFLLFLTNLVGIIGVAVMVFSTQKYGRWKKAFLYLAVLGAACFFLVKPLKETLYLRWVEGRVLRIHSLISSKTEASSRSKITGVHANRKNGTLHIRINGVIAIETVPDFEEGVERAQKTLSKDLGEYVELEFDLIPVQRFRFGTSDPLTEPKNTGETD